MKWRSPHGRTWRGILLLTLLALLSWQLSRKPLDNVTNRVGPFTCGKPGQQNTVEMVALPWHFGFAGLITGGPQEKNYAANQLAPMVGDANTMIPEYKVFLVQVEKA